MIKFNLYQFFKKLLLLLFSVVFIFIGSIYILGFKSPEEQNKLSISKEKYSILYSILLMKNRVFNELDTKWRNRRE